MRCELGRCELGRFFGKVEIVLLPEQAATRSGTREVRRHAPCTPPLNAVSRDHVNSRESTSTACRGTHVFELSLWMAHVFCSDHNLWANNDVIKIPMCESVGSPGPVRFSLHLPRSPSHLDSLAFCLHSLDPAKCAVSLSWYTTFDSTALRPWCEVPLVDHKKGKWNFVKAGSTDSRVSQSTFGWSSHGSAFRMGCLQMPLMDLVSPAHMSQLESK